MHLLKLLFQELQLRPTTPQRQLTAPLGDQLTTQGKNAEVFFYLIFPEFQNLSPHLVYSLLWKGWLEQNLRLSVRVWTRCLLRLPAIWRKHPQRFNPYLCLLGSVCDRQHECQFFLPVSIMLSNLPILVSSWNLKLIGDLRVGKF